VNVILPKARAKHEILFNKPASGLKKRLGMQGTNTLAYYEHLQITAVKSFVTLGPGLSYWFPIRSYRDSTWQACPRDHTWYRAERQEEEEEEEEREEREGRGGNGN